MTPSAEPTSKWERQTGKPMTAVLHTREGPARGAPAAAPVQRRETRQVGVAVELEGSKRTSMTVSTSAESNDRQKLENRKAGEGSHSAVRDTCANAWAARRMCSGTYR